MSAFERLERLTAASVWLATVIRLRATGAEFASFCLCHSCCRIPNEVMYRRLNIRWPSGKLDGVVVATSFVDRLLGLRRSGVPGLIIDAPSVHTFGMRDPIVVVEATLFGVVTGVHRVAPRRIHRRTRGGPMLEIRGGTTHPAVGDRLTLLPCP